MGGTQLSLVEGEFCRFAICWGQKMGSRVGSIHPLETGGAQNIFLVF